MLTYNTFEKSVSYLKSFRDVFMVMSNLFFPEGCQAHVLDAFTNGSHYGLLVDAIALGFNATAKKDYNRVIYRIYDFVDTNPSQYCIGCQTGNMEPKCQMILPAVPDAFACSKRDELKKIYNAEMEKRQKRVGSHEPVMAKEDFVRIIGTLRVTAKGNNTFYSMCQALGDWCNISINGFDEATLLTLNILEETLDLPLISEHETALSWWLNTTHCGKREPAPHDFIGIPENHPIRTADIRTPEELYDFMFGCSA